LTHFLHCNANTHGHERNISEQFGRYSLRVLAGTLAILTGFSHFSLVPPEGRAGFPPPWPGFDPRSGHVGFVVDKVARGQVFSDYFGFSCQFSFQQLHIHLPSAAGAIGQTVADIPSGLSLTPTQEELVPPDICRSSASVRPRPFPRRSLLVHLPTILRYVYYTLAAPYSNLLKK
jgi:hypothetical protein